MKTEVLKLIKNTSSTNEKIFIGVTEFGKEEHEYMCECFNDTIYGISETNIAKAIGYNSSYGKFEDLGDFLDIHVLGGEAILHTDKYEYNMSLKEFLNDINKYSGNEQIEKFTENLKKVDPIYRSWYIKCVLKNPRIGISFKNYNIIRIKQGLEPIKKWYVKLAETLEPGQFELLDYPVYAEIKYDGCLMHNSKIITDKGIYNIKDIVDNKLKLNVLSFNEEKKIFEYKPIVNWFNNGNSKRKDWLQIDINNHKKLKCTLNHKILTHNGWKQAKDLKWHDTIVCNEISKKQKGIIVGMILGDGCVSYENRTKNSKYYTIILTSSVKESILFKKYILDMNITYSTHLSNGYTKNKEMYNLTINNIAKTNFPIESFYDNKLKKYKIISNKTLIKNFTDESLSIWYSEDGHMGYNNGNENTPLFYLNTQRYTKEQIDIFVDFFKEKYNVSPYINFDKRCNTYGAILKFNTIDSLKLYDIIKDKMVKGYEYKYFIKEGYITKASYKIVYKKFKVDKISSQKDYTKYDIEVKDNHNYIADNIIVHNCRFAAFYNSGKVEKILSRNGNDITKEYPEVIRDIEKYFKNQNDINSITIDGEIISKNFNALQKRMNRLESNINEDFDLTFIVFDIIELNGNNLIEHKLQTRRNILNDIVNQLGDNGLFKLSGIIAANDSFELNNFYENAVKNKEEGIMVKYPNSKWALKEDDRKDWYKVKPVYTSDLKIYKAEFGNGKNKDYINILYVKDKNENIKTKVSSGITDDLRKKLTSLYNENKLIGTIVEIKYNEITETNSLRFPRVISLRFDKDKPDSLNF